MNCEIIGQLFLILGEYHKERGREKFLKHVSGELVYTRPLQVHFYSAKCFPLLPSMLIAFQKENVLLWTTLTFIFLIQKNSHVDVYSQR